MKYICTLFALVAFLHAAPLKPVRTEGGMLTGVAAADGTVAAYKGVAFAAAPVGPLRWAAPQAPAKWAGVKAADSFGANCVQTIVEEKKPWTHEFMAHGDVSEDCLFLNIWAPARAGSEKRPVFVYLHGGANTEGSGSVALYDGEALARKGLVMITVNYRLGVLGFLSHPELTKESGHNSSGNYALLDQIAALRWVRDNIAAFGGDPARVTVAGQSAGAADIALLTVSPLAKGLFHREILESGGSTFNGAGKTLAAQEADGVKFAELKGALTLTDLRAMSWKDLTAPVQGAPRFGPVIDGYVLPASPKDAFAAGTQNDVVTLAGYNADESGASPKGTPEANENAREKQRLATLAWATARGAKAKTTSYIYYWDHTLPGPDAAQYGAFHTSEVPYVLNTLGKSDRAFTAADRKIADTLSSYWANFAANGDPNGQDLHGKPLPHWPSVREQPEMVMELGDRTAAIPASAHGSTIAAQ
jgi:para-nitrobenzyl esterase